MRRSGAGLGFDASSEPTTTENAAQGEVDASGQAHGGDDDAQLAGLGQRFDDASAGAIAQSAVMIGDPALEQLGQVFAHQQLLLGAELERIGRGQLPGQLVGHGFGGLPARGKDQDRPQIIRQRLGDQPGPVAADLRRARDSSGYWHGPPRAAPGAGRGGSGRPCGQAVAAI